MNNGFTASCAKCGGGNALLTTLCKVCVHDLMRSNPPECPGKNSCRTYSGSCSNCIRGTKDYVDNFRPKKVQQEPSTISEKIVES